MTISELRALLAKAMTRPWDTDTWESVYGTKHRVTYKARGLNKGANFIVADMNGTEGNDEGNAALIAAAVNALPALLDVAEAAAKVSCYQNAASHELEAALAKITVTDGNTA